MGLLWYTFPLLNLDLGRELLIMLAFGMLAEWLAVVIPQGHLTGGFAVVLATYLIYGPVPAAWVTALAALLGQGVANRGNPLRSTLFRAAQYVPVVLGANFIYVLVGGEPVVKLSWANAWPLALFICLFYIINQMFMYIYNLPGRDDYHWLRRPGTLSVDGLNYLVAVPLGLFTVWLYQYMGIYSALLLFIPMLAVQFVLQFYLHLRQHKRELSLIYEASRRLEGSLSLKELCDYYLIEARELYDFGDGVIYFWSEEQKCFVPEAALGNQAELFKDTAVQQGEGFLGRVAESGDVHLVDDIREDERTSGDQGLTLVHRSLLVVPLVAETKVVGLLMLGDKRVGVFDEEHVRLMTVLGGQVALAFANLRLGRWLDQAQITDRLTGLYNYQYFHHRALGELEQARRLNEHISMVMLDIENFKRVNNGYGQLTGDMVLTGVADVILGQVRDCDLVARYGGDQFAVLLPQTGPAEAKHVADRLRLAVRERVYEVGGSRIFVRVSTGLATFPEGAADLNALFKGALKDLEGEDEASKV